MRVLRSSMWADPDNDPATIIVRDSDVTDSLESIREQLLDPPTGAGSEYRPFVTFDIFEMKDAEILGATQEAAQRQDLDRERDMAILFFFATQTVLPITNANGLWIAPDPSPLSLDQIELALNQVAMHPVYEQQKVVFLSEDGERITLENGEVKR